jgi:N-acetyl-anhydromuramyl-L-alanine amidase AmpD
MLSLSLRVGMTWAYHFCCAHGRVQVQGRPVGCARQLAEIARAAIGPDLAETRAMRIVYASLLLAACSVEPSTHVEDLPGPRNDAYRAAADKYGISEDWLVSLGFQQGRFEPAQETDAQPDPSLDMTDTAYNLMTDTPVVETDDPDQDAADPMSPPDDVASFGIMYLTNDQIARAAQLTSLDADSIKTDIAANITGAAAILSADTQALGSLTEATLAFLGVEDDAASLAIDDLDVAQSMGFDVTTTDGERIVLDGTGAATPVLAESDAVETDAVIDDPSRLKAGSMPSYQWIPSPNFGSREGDKIHYVIIHDIEGTMAGAISVFKNPATEVSAHYIVRSHDGHIVKMVLERDDAWHCGHGWFNRHSIGIEHEGFAHKKDGGGYYTETLYKASAALTCSLAVRYDIPVDRKHIFGHLNVPSNLDSHTLCSDAEGVAGKCGGIDHHTDPGQYWDWKTYMNLVSDCVKAAK